MSDKVDKLVPTRINRRTLLSRSAGVMGGLVAGQLLRPETAEAQTRPAAGAPRSDNTWNVTVCGEIMATRPFSMQTEPEFQSIVKLVRESDLAYGHLEMNLATDEEVKWAARGSAGVASYMIANPRIAEDLKWAGFDAVSCAMNHSMDWGVEGMQATIKHCQRAGIAVAGTGMDLEDARRPTYFEKDKGRVALISVSSGNSAYEWAGLGKGPIPGRPGINPLRVRTVYEVDHATAEQLKATGRKLGVLSAAAAARKEFNITPGSSAGVTGFSGFSFVDGDKFEISTVGHPKDIEGNLRSVDEARQMADFVMVAHHNSTSEGGRGNSPSKFAVDFARKAIDAGADMFIGHGWHTALGIEIYKNKPIIYGLGNFFFESGFLSRIPPDSFESYGYDMDRLTTLNPAVGDLHPGTDNEDWCWSAVYQFKFEGKKLAEIRLHPVELGMDFSAEKSKVTRQIGSGPHPYLDGSPRMATGANGQKLLERMQKLCALRGTKLEIKDGVGTVRIPA